MTALIVEDMPQAAQVLQQDIETYCLQVEIRGVANSGTITAPTALSSIEFLPITVGANGTTQTFTTWTPSTFGLSRARWALSALPATAATNSIVTINS